MAFKRPPLPARPAPPARLAPLAQAFTQGQVLWVESQAPQLEFSGSLVLPSPRLESLSLGANWVLVRTDDGRRYALDILTGAVLGLAGHSV